MKADPKTPENCASGSRQGEFAKPSRVSAETALEVFLRGRLASKGVDPELVLREESGEEPCQEPLRGRLFHEEDEMLNLHRVDLPLEPSPMSRGRSGSPTPNIPSIHRSPRSAPSSMNSVMPGMSAARFDWVWPASSRHRTRTSSRA